MHRLHNAARNPLTGDVGELLIQQLRRISSALADQMLAEPVPRDALQLTEEVELWFVVLIAPVPYRTRFVK